VAWEQNQSTVLEAPSARLLGLGLDQALATTGDWHLLMLPQFALGAADGTPPTNRGTIPPSTGSNKITRFNNPNTSTFPSAKSSVPSGFRNKIGYQTYVQFMMDFGRDQQPDGSNYTPLSINSPDCPMHSEGTDGGTFKFPPREQPMHACRRGLIAAIQIVKERNQNIPDPQNRDWVSIVTFDKLTGGSKPIVHQALTGDYDAAMQACTTIQACSDSGLTTATEAGLSAARDHIKPSSEGGMGRLATNKVVTLLTDGVPNDYESSTSSIDKFMADNSSSEYYGGGYYWLDAPLMQTTQMQAQNWQVFPVGIGLGTDYDFMDRMARMGGTDSKGQSPRGSGNPAEYEQRLKDIFDQIIKSPRVRLVQ
jgi:hypothetical protein